MVKYMTIYGKTSHIAYLQILMALRIQSPNIYLNQMLPYSFSGHKVNEALSWMCTYRCAKKLIQGKKCMYVSYSTIKHRQQLISLGHFYSESFFLKYSFLVTRVLVSAHITVYLFLKIHTIQMDVYCIYMSKPSLLSPAELQPYLFTLSFIVWKEKQLKFQPSRFYRTLCFNV